MTVMGNLFTMGIGKILW